MNASQEFVEEDIFVHYSLSYDRILRYTKAHWQLLNISAHYLHGKKNILDVCCGTGLLAERFYGTNTTVTGIDIESTMLDYAHSKFKGDSFIRLLEGDAHTIPFPDSTFDATVILNGLYCTKHPIKVLDELKRVTREGGTVIISGPLKGHTFETIAQEIENDVKRIGMHDDLKAHLDNVKKSNESILQQSTFHFFTMEEITAIMRNTFKRILLKRDDVYYGAGYLFVVET